MCHFHVIGSLTQEPFAPAELESDGRLNRDSVMQSHVITGIGKCLTHLNSISEQMLISTPTKLTHSSTTLSRVALSKVCDTSCWETKMEILGYWNIEAYI